MKLLIFLSLLVLPGLCFAQYRDTLDSDHRSSIMLTGTIFEAGAMIPFQEQTPQDLPYGLPEYLGKYRTASVFNLAAIGIWYKEKIGIEVMLLRLIKLKSGSGSYNDWLGSYYPDYYVKGYGVSPENFIEINRPAYRLAYRCNFRQFQLTSKVQVGFTNFATEDRSIMLKEKGSNQIIEYRLKTENLNKRIIDYRIMFEISRRFNQSENLPQGFEYAVRTGISAMPTNFRYAVTEIPYGQPSNTFTIDQQRNRFYLTIEGMVRYYIKW